MYPEKIAGSVQQQLSGQQQAEKKQGQQVGIDPRKSQLDKEMLQDLQNLHQSGTAEHEKNEDKEDREKSDSLFSEDLKHIQDATNELLAKMNIQLDFEINNELEKVIVKVKNRENGEVIRQIPPEEILRMAQRMQEMSGMLLDKEI